MNSDYHDLSYKQQCYSGRYEKSSNSESSRHSASGSKIAFEESRLGKGGAAQNFRINGFKQMRTMGSNRSNEQLMGRDRRGSLGMDSCDYNSSSSGYFDEHADYETQ